MSKINLDELVQLFKETRNERYFTVIYNNLQKPLLSFIRKTVYDLDTANEILSKAFEDIYLGIVNDKYTKQNATTFSTWAHTCAINATRYYLRYYNKTKANDTFTMLENTPYSNVDELVAFQLEQEDKYNKTINYIYALEDPLLTIVKRVYIEKDKIKTVADDLGITVNNVKYSLIKFKNKIRNDI